MNLWPGGALWPAIAAVGDDAVKGCADLRLGLRDRGGERVAIVGIAGQRLGVGDELASGRAMQRGGDRHLEAEFVGPMRLALADTFDLGRVQGIDLWPSLMLALLAHAAGEHERTGEGALQVGVGLDLAHDVARDPAEISADRLQRPVGALELLGVGIPLMGDQRMFADPLVGLAQPDAGFLRQLTSRSRARCISLASVGKAIALGCNKRAETRRFPLQRSRR